MTDWELIGVPYTSMARPGGIAEAIGALRSAGLAERLAGLGVPDTGDMELDAPSGERGPSGLLNEQALAQLVVTTRDLVSAAHGRDRAPLLVGGDCPVLLGALAARQKSPTAARYRFARTSASFSTTERLAPVGPRKQSPPLWPQSMPPRSGFTSTSMCSRRRTSPPSTIHNQQAWPGTSSTSWPRSLSPALPAGERALSSTTPTSTPIGHAPPSWSSSSSARSSVPTARNEPDKPPRRRLDRPAPRSLSSTRSATRGSSRTSGSRRCPSSRRPGRMP